MSKKELKDEAWKVYREAEAPFRKAYWEAESPFLKAYEDAVAPLWEELQSKLKRIEDE